MLEDKFHQGDIPNWSLEERIVFSFLRGLTRHEGLRHEWARIEPDTKEEILQEWLGVVEKELMAKALRTWLAETNS